MTLDSQPISETRLRVTNLARDTVLATCLEQAGTGATRSKGLLGRKDLPTGGGLWIVPCESVRQQVDQEPRRRGPQKKDGSHLDPPHEFSVKQNARERHCCK